MEQPSQTTRPATTALQVEATLGAFFAFVVVFTVVVAASAMVFAANQNHATGDGLKMVTVVVPVVALECLFAYQLKVALEGAHYPFAPWFALTRRRWPLVLRPVVAAWWAGHFLLGVAAAVLAENLIVTGAARWDVRVVRGVAFLVVSFTVAYSANLYALLAVAAVGGGPTWVNRLWRGRLLLDVGVAAVAATFPFLARSPPQRSPPPPNAVPDFVRRHRPRPVTAPATAASVATPPPPAVGGTPRP